MATVLQVAMNRSFTVAVVAWMAIIGSAGADLRRVETATQVAYNTPPRNQAMPAVQRQLLLSLAVGEFSDNGGSEKTEKAVTALANSTGIQVTYRPVTSWWDLQVAVSRAEPDIIFASPHLAGWVTANKQYDVLAGAVGNVSYEVIVSAGNATINSLKDLGGRKICAQLPPSIGTLLVMKEFDNPTRRPTLSPSTDWNHAYEGIVANRCDAAILPTHLYATKKSGLTRKIFTSASVPNTALLIKRNMDPQLKLRLMEAAQKTDIETALAGILGASHRKGKFEAMDAKTYQDVALRLRDEWSW